MKYFANLYGIPSHKLKLKIDGILKILDLYEQKDIPVEKYSKGMKQRLQIARGLINDPDYLFMDEPTLGLDILIAKELRAYIKKIAYKENKGIVLTTHYIAEAEELCDFIYVINEGVVVFEGTADELKQKYSVVHKWKIGFNSLDKDMLSSLIKYDKSFVNIIPNCETNEVIIESDKDKITNVISWANENNIEICQFTNMEISLEDALFKLMEESESAIMG